MAAISSGTVSAAEFVPRWGAPQDQVPDKDLAGLDERELLDIVRVSPQGGRRRTAACELLVSRHQNLVWSCVRRYLSSPEPAEDLMQVGYVGLLKAIGNFDPAAGCSLASSSGISGTSAGRSGSSARCRSWSWKSVRRPGGWPRSWAVRRPNPT
jgi:Sigma-70 region 2